MRNYANHQLNNLIIKLVLLENKEIVPHKMKNNSFHILSYMQTSREIHNCVLEIFLVTYQTTAREKQH